MIIPTVQLRLARIPTAFGKRVRPNRSSKFLHRTVHDANFRRRMAPAGSNLNSPLSYSFRFGLWAVPLVHRSKGRLLQLMLCFIVHYSVP